MTNDNTDQPTEQPQDEEQRQAEEEPRQAGPYTDEEMVRVATPDGRVLPDPVPRAWLGTDMLPEGMVEADTGAVEETERALAADEEARAATGSASTIVYPPAEGNEGIMAPAPQPPATDRAAEPSVGDVVEDPVTDVTQAEPTQDPVPAGESVQSGPPMTAEEPAQGEEPTAPRKGRKRGAATDGGE